MQIINTWIHFSLCLITNSCHPDRLMLDRSSSVSIFPAVASDCFSRELVALSSKKGKVQVVAAQLWQT